MKIYFYDPNDTYGWLANFAIYPIIENGILYKTVEHYYQSKKFINKEIENLIINSETPAEAKDLARKHTKQKLENWGEIKVDVMYHASILKFEQNPSLKIKIIETANNEIIEQTTVDSFWGCGSLNNGKNAMGQILMQIRELLKTNNSLYSLSNLECKFIDHVRVLPKTNFKLHCIVEKNLNKRIFILENNLNVNSIPLIRVQFGCTLGTTFGLLDCDCHLQLKKSISMIAKHNNGVIIYLPDDDGRGIGFDNKINFLSLQRSLNETPVKTARYFNIEYKNYHMLNYIPRIFEYLNIHNSVQLITNNPLKSILIQIMGIEVTQTKMLNINKKWLSDGALKEIEEKTELLGHRK